MQQTARPDRATLPYPHPRQNSHIGANPAILLDDNVPPKRRSIAPHPSPRVDRVSCTHQLHIRAEDASRPDCHGTGIRNPAISPNEDIIPNGDVVAVVAVERRFDNDALAAVAEGEGEVCWWGFAIRKGGLGCGAQAQDLSEEAGAFFRAGAVGGVRCIVKSPDGCYAALAVFGEGGGERVVVQAFQHLFPLGVAFVAAIGCGARGRGVRESGLGGGLDVVVWGGVVVIWGVRGL